MYAINNGYWDMVRLLLEMGADSTEEHDMNGARGTQSTPLPPRKKEVNRMMHHPKAFIGNI